MKPYNHNTRKNTIIRIDFEKRQKGLNDNDYKDEYLEINSVDLDLNENIYRIFNYEYFLNDLKDNMLTLVHPHKWQDPYENFFLNADGIRDDGLEISFENVKNSFYSQCWSLKEECDGLWRNYKGINEFAIQVKTNAKKLFSSIYDINNTFHYLSFFIGKVDYLDNDEFAHYFDEKVDFNNFQSGMEFATTLLVKRKPFAYEEEIRIIVKRESDTQHDNTNDIFRIPSNLNDVIEEIVFDPWVTDIIFKEKSQELRALGYSGLIKKSNLYENPKFIINV
ncbi:MAG: hypothetical protein ABF239_03955 [Wenyingzhuangia sp.]